MHIYVPLSAAVMAVMIYIIGRLLVSNATLKLEKNHRQLVETLRDYVLVLRIYKRVLIAMKNDGKEISDMPMPWLERRTP